MHVCVYVCACVYVCIAMIEKHKTAVNQNIIMINMI